MHAHQLRDYYATPLWGTEVKKHRALLGVIAFLLCVIAVLIYLSFFRS